jgi:uncharacterized membrane protein
MMFSQVLDNIEGIKMNNEVVNAVVESIFHFIVFQGFI